jgi:prepilin peptidase CpaA
MESHFLSQVGPQSILALALLSFATFTDLKTKKISNKLVIVTFAVSVLFSFVSQNFGLSAFVNLLTSFATAVIFLLPLWMMKAVGGGDIKFLIALSPLLPWQSLILMILFSLIWGGLLGVLRVLLSGQGKSFLTNLKLLLLRQKLETSTLHTMPYSVALLLGFLSQITVTSLGVNFL